MIDKKPFWNNLDWIPIAETKIIQIHVYLVSVDAPFLICT